MSLYNPYENVNIRTNNDEDLCNAMTENEGSIDDTGDSCLITYNSFSYGFSLDTLCIELAGGTYSNGICDIIESGTFDYLLDGDAITFTSNGTEYTGTIVKEGDVKHTKCKVSDTADSKKIYGLFSNWDDADDGLDGDINDMNIAQVGTYIIRVNKDVTVSAGDLLVSNGDGTAKKQDDDIIRSKTVAKVNSNIKVETYSDGSYTVPCTLHC